MMKNKLTFTSGITVWNRSVSSGCAFNSSTLQSLITKMQSQRCPGACAIFSEILRKNLCIFWRKKSLSNFIQCSKKTRQRIREKMFPDFWKNFSYFATMNTSLQRIFWDLKFQPQFLFESKFFALKELLNWKELLKELKWDHGTVFYDLLFSNEIEFALKMTKKFNIPSKYDKNTAKSCRLLSKLNEENDQNFFVTKTRWEEAMEQKTNPEKIESSMNLWTEVLKRV
jgi:hypothetical protein